MPFSKESAFEQLSESRGRAGLRTPIFSPGPAGSGKSWLAVHLAALVLECSPETALAHPDVHMVQPESKSRRIVIDQIRELEHSIQRKPLLASSKVAIIHDADRLQPQAANAFLKTLEEPPPGLADPPFEHTTKGDPGNRSLALRRNPTPGSDQARARPQRKWPYSRRWRNASLNDAIPGVAEAFRFTRTLQSILLSLCAKRSPPNTRAILRKETARYKQASRRFFLA